MARLAIVVAPVLAVLFLSPIQLNGYKGLVLPSFLPTPPLYLYYYYHLQHTFHPFSLFAYVYVIDEQCQY
jgi:hypothetical protein